MAWAACIAALVVFAPRTFAAEAAASPEAHPPWQVYLALERHCAECHGGHLTKPKAELGYILDLRRLIAENYVRPGKPDDSDLYLSLVSDDPDIRMPPADSDALQPDEKTIELIRAWIAQGAPLHDGSAPATANGASTETSAASGGSTDGSASAAAAAPARKMPLPRLLGRLHPLVVHFPIALLLCALAAETALRFRPAQVWLAGMTRGSLWIGLAGSVVAASFGWLNARYEGFAGGEVETHRWLGITTAALALVALVVCEWAERTRLRSPHGRRPVVVLIVLIAAAIVVSLAGHTGGLLAYGRDYLWKI